MSQQRRRLFDKDFKINAVRLILNKSKKISALSRELGINAATLHMWKNQYLKDSETSFPGKGHQTPVEEELKKLRQENKVLQEERDILKKALGIFSKA